MMEKNRKEWLKTVTKLIRYFIDNGYKIVTADDIVKLTSVSTATANRYLRYISARTGRPLIRIGRKNVLLWDPEMKRKFPKSLFI